MLYYQIISIKGNILKYKECRTAFLGKTDASTFYKNTNAILSRNKILIVVSVPQIWFIWEISF